MAALFSLLETDVSGWNDDINCAIFLKLHNSVAHCEQSVIAADANITTRAKLGSALTKNDIPRLDLLTAINFHAETF